MREEERGATRPGTDLGAVAEGKVSLTPISSRPHQRARRSRALKQAFP